jgi:hypothetical protein
MGLTRQSIVRGPAIVQMGGQTFYSKGDIKVAIAPETFDVSTSVHGKVGQRMKDLMAKITFVPAGMWTAGQLAVLFPHTNPTFGASLFGSTDVPVTIHPVDGAERMVFTSGAITKMPGVVLSPVETALKEVEITCVLGNGLDRSNAAALYTYTASATFTDTSFSLANVLTVPYTASLAAASAPWNAIETEAGFECSFDLKTSPVKVGNLGTIDFSVSALDISVKLKPVGMTVKQVLDRLKVQSTGVALGMDMSAGAANLTITGGTNNPQVVINNVRLKDSNLIYGAEALRHDTIELIATRPSGGGAMFTIGLGA